jgi:hypothetical protein
MLWSLDHGGKKWVYGVVVVLCRGREKSKVVILVLIN